MIWVVVAVALSYLAGALPGGTVLGRPLGVDLRQSGSGNVGATNAVRAQGPVFGASVFAFDAGKGALAAGLLPWIAPAPLVWLPIACGAAAILGHVFPLWFGFRGGKGFATTLGVIAVLSPLALAPIAGVWVLVLLATGYVSAATLCGGIAYPVFVAALPGAAYPPLLGFAGGIALFLFYTHRANVRRLLRGDEHRFHRVWMLGRGRR